jgi:phosphoglycolate phosphatase
VLWDIDYTLIAAPGGDELYRLALDELYGLPLPTGLQSMAGRTDSAIALEVLSRAGLADPEAEVPRFQAVLARLAPQAHGIVVERGRVLPGAAAAISALASVAARPVAAAGPPLGVDPAGASADGRALAADGQVIQSLLTGNIPALAKVKLSALGLTAHLDLDIGAYGDVSRTRADLVPVARRNAAARYGGDYSGRATVLVGDTPSDIEAAAAHGARSVAVASGQFTAQQLAAADADAVLADLTDTSEVLSAIVTGRP